MLSHTIASAFTNAERTALNQHMQDAATFRKHAKHAAENWNWQTFAAYTSLAHSCVQDADAIRQAVIRRISY